MRQTRVRNVAPAIALALGLGLVGSSGVARAEPQTDPKAAAEQLFEDGKELVAAKRYAEACPKFAESLRLDPGIGIMLHLASCWEKAGKPASAWAQFREAEQVAMRDRDNRIEVARRRAEALEPRLYRVTIRVRSDVEGLTIVRDGLLVGRPQWGTALPFDPGDHLVVAEAPGKRRWETKLHVPAEPGTAELVVPELQDLPKAPPPIVRQEVPADPHRGRTQRTVGIVVAGVGIAGLAVGTYFGLRAKSLLDDSNADGHCLPNDHCDQYGGDKRNDSRTAGNISTIAFGVGAAALAAGIVTYDVAPKPIRGSTGKAFQLAPLVGANGAGLVVAGGF